MLRASNKIERALHQLRTPLRYRRGISAQTAYVFPPSGPISPTVVGSGRIVAVTSTLQRGQELFRDDAQLFVLRIQRGNQGFLGIVDVFGEFRQIDLQGHQLQSESLE